MQNKDTDVLINRPPFLDVRQNLVKRLVIKFITSKMDAYISVNNWSSSDEADHHLGDVSSLGSQPVHDAGLALQSQPRPARTTLLFVPYEENR